MRAGLTNGPLSAKGGWRSWGRRQWFAVLAAFISAVVFLPADSQAQKFLTKPIEFVCHAAVGGGSDIMARFMQSVIEKEKLCSQPVAVVNRAGGGGAIAFAYVAGKKGDPHYLADRDHQFSDDPSFGKIEVHLQGFHSPDEPRL